MSQRNKLIYLIITIIVILFLVVVLTPRQEEKYIEEEVEGFTLKEISDLEAAPEIEVTEEPIVVAPGASLVDQEGVVLTEEGEAVNSDDVGVGSKDAPQQSEILEEEKKEQVAENSLNMEVSRETGFVPNVFRVKPGQAVTILLTVTDNQKHIFRFKDSRLRAVAVTVKAGESRAITFNAPTQIGSYEFICGDPSHSATGQMVVVNE
ncbi:cupredoxin domain-containing protein [Patescibacteria group bacterium]|nr:cupredoxin domain-containing protein [Patescibacteria group bacterium]